VQGFKPEISGTIQTNTVKKYFQDLLSQHFSFCQINLNNVFSSDNLLF